MCDTEDLSSRQLYEDIEKTLNDDFTWWDVDKDGNITYKGHTKTFIDATRLTESTLLYHTLTRVRNGAEKEANSEFFFAYMRALKNAGYKKIVIDVCDSLYDVTVTK